MDIKGVYRRKWTSRGAWEKIDIEGVHGRKWTHVVHGRQKDIDYTGEMEARLKGNIQ